MKCSFEGRGLIALVGKKFPSHLLEEFLGKDEGSQKGLIPGRDAVSIIRLGLKIFKVFRLAIEITGRDHSVEGEYPNLC